MNKKKYSKTIDPPSSNEIKASDICHQLELAFDNFQKTKSDEQFQQFIKIFTTFLNEETSKKLLIYFSEIMIQNIIDHVSSIEFKSVYADQAFTLINTIIIKMGVIFSASSFTTFFLFLANGDDERIKILTENEKIISNIFSEESFFYDFINGDLFVYTFQKIFLYDLSKEICKFYSHIIFTSAPISLLSNYDYQPIINNLQQKSKYTNSDEIALFITHLFSKNVKYQYYFNDKNNFEYLTKLFDSASFDTIIQCFQFLLFIDPPNYSLFKNIVNFYQNNIRIQDQFFVWIFEFVKSYPNIVSEINSIVPFSNWITSKTPVSRLLNSMKLMNSIHPSLVSQFLSLYFSLLCKEESDIDSYICGIGIVESQIFHRRISLSFLLNSLFLNAYIVKPSIDMLNEIFLKSYTFAQLVYDIYALPDATPIRKEVLTKIIQVSLKNNELTSIVSAFLVISGSNENIKEMMDLIESSKKGELCESFCSAFPKSHPLTINFLNEYGMKWIDSIFTSHIIDLNMVKNLIMGLTSRESNENVDDFIESLPKNHSLFSLEGDDLRSLIYGCEDPPVYYPIRVYSLFHLIPCPWSIDPYNAYIIGKHVLDKYDDIMNLPIIGEIGNRYINSDTFYEFLKTPTELEQFCDPSYDHFPVFQVFEYTEEKVFEMEFKSISFWFRFQSSIDDSLKIPFFHASKFNLFLKKSNLIANYEGTEYEVPINPLNWNHIYLSITSNLISHKIKIWVNLSKAVFTSPTKLNNLSNFGFIVYASYLYIGTSIRVYQSELNESKKIFELGPSSIEKLNEDFMITPSLNFSSDKNILPVPYKGFPSHFESRSKLNYFFEILRKTENETDFEKLLSLFYKIYLIARRSVNDLFYSLLTFFSSIPNRLTKDRFIDVLNFFGSHKNHKTLMNEIIKNKSFWNNVSNDIIIYSLVYYFKTFDFYEDIDNFQYFLSSKMISNQKSKYIMTSFLVNSKALPKCQKCLLALFLCHHFMRRRDDKETQALIKTARKTVNKNNKIDIQTNQYFQLVNRKNISIECQIIDDKFSNYFDEQLLLFHQAKNTELQFTLIDCFYDFIQKTGTTENVKFILPMEDLLSLFIVSSNKFKASLFKIFVLIEKISPGFIVVNNLFLTSFFPLFVYKSVWDETMSLITNDGEIINNNSPIVLILALLWSLTVASIHCVARTGKNLNLNFDKEIKFCSSNSSVFASNKTAQHFFRIWYPLLLGFINDKADPLVNPVRLESIEITPPKVSCFYNYILKTVILSSLEIDGTISIKTDQFYPKEFKEFLSKSELILFLNNFLLASSDAQFIQNFSPLLLIPSISDKEISELFICEFTTNCLTYLSQTFKLEMPFIPFIQILHCLSNNGFLKSNFQFILSDVFVIMTLLHDLHNKTFKKVANSLNNLLIDLFSNCDNESLHLLFNILQQHVLLFIEMIQMTNTLDLYLSFFQKVSKNCYKEFDVFFKKFLNSIQIHQQNKRIEDLLNHVELTDISQLNKLNKTVNSFNSIIKLVKSEVNECFTLMMIELTENTKEFSITYYVSKKRQINFCDFLNRKFNSLDQDEEDYLNSIKLIQEKMIDSITLNINDLSSQKVLNNVNNKNKKLLPFSFPFSLPRLFVPVPIQSPNDALKFIVDQKLYTTNISSFENFEKISLASTNAESDNKANARQKGRKNSLSAASLSSNLSNLQPSEMSSGGEFLKKRSNSLRSVASQPLTKREEVQLTSNTRKRNMSTNSSSFESHIQLTRSNSSSNSNAFSSSSFQSKPIIFNCQLVRFNYSIQAVVSVSLNNLRLIPFCRYESNAYLNSNSSLLTFSSNSNNLNDDSNSDIDPIDLNSSSPRGNSSLDPEFVSKFVMEVINGFWGETQLFEKRIVIKIPLNTILYISQKSDKCFTLWTQKSGTFMLNKVENDVFEKVPFYDMNPLSYIEKVADKNEAIEKWIDGQLPTSQMIVALNISEGRDYVDLRNFVKLPDSFTIFGTFSPINESLAANLTEGLMIGNEEYSNSIELTENDQTVIDFVKKFDISSEIEKRTKVTKGNFTISDKILCQKISGIVSKWSLFDNTSIVSDLPHLSAKISSTDSFYIVVDKVELCAYLFDYSEGSQVFTLNSTDFSKAKSLSVSQNFMFFSVDFENNVSSIYRIVYDACLPSKIEFIRKSSFLYDQITTVNGSELLAGTFSGKTVYIWPFYRFSYHRIINFDEKVRFCRFDDNAGTFWVCNDYNCYLFDLNGQLFSSHKFEKKISAFNVVPQTIGECSRTAICGFDDGSISLISLSIESGELFVKTVNSMHKSKIIEITFHPKKTYFITIDNCMNAFFWTKKNVDENAEEVDINLFGYCPSCRKKKPYKFCSSCKRAFCSECLNESNVCHDCLSTD